MSSSMPRLKRLFNAAVEILFPRFMRLSVQIFRDNELSIKGIVLGYLFIFFVLFVMQGAGAAISGMFMPDNSDSTKTFLEDLPNAINFAFLCEAYCITGFYFLLQTYTIRNRLRENGFEITNEDPLTITRRGYLAALAILILALVGSAGYAREIHTYKYFYWFMQAGPPSVTLGLWGYYYLFVNMLLLLFIIWVGFAHFGLFHVGRDISRHLENIAKTKDEASIQEWAQDELPKIRLEAFSKYIVTSKLLVFWIMLNMLTWKRNEPNIGLMYELSVVITAIFGIWIFSLPRYSVQRHLFKIRQIAGKSSYPEVRGPWILGLSSLLDIVLFSFVANYLLGDAIGKLFKKIFS